MKDEINYDIISLETNLRGAQKELIDELTSVNYSPHLKQKRDRFLQLLWEYWREKEDEHGS